MGFAEEELKETTLVVTIEFIHGIAAILFCLSQLILPFNIHLPKPFTWLLPAQQADPSIVGLNWPDMIFPVFLFALGTSISLQFRRLPGLPSFFSYVFFEWLALVVLSIFLGNFTFTSLIINASKSCTTESLLLSLLAFLCIFLMCVDIPLRMNVYLVNLIRLVALAGAILIATLYTSFPRDSFFSLTNRFAFPLFSLSLSSFPLSSTSYFLTISLPSLPRDFNLVVMASCWAFCAVW